MCTTTEPTTPATTGQALAMVRAGLGYLAGCDAASLGTAVQAEALIGLEHAEAQQTAGSITKWSSTDGDGRSPGTPTAPAPPPHPTDAPSTPTAHPSKPANQRPVPMRGGRVGADR
jgi:hypothetical protein